MAVPDFIAALPPLAGLPDPVRSRFVDNGNGLLMHCLEAGAATAQRPVVLLLHGFPELAYSWRKIIMPLVEAGFHVIAPDQRGYGRTVDLNYDAQRQVHYDDDPSPSCVLNLVRDQLGLLSALGITEVAAVVGHDFGSPVAAWCALTRPDIFRKVALMSAPFAGAPGFSAAVKSVATAIDHHGMLQLPRPRLHYQWYYSTREANDNMVNCPQGVHDFLRAYYHVKSADWPQNKPFELSSWSGADMAQMPTYYIMNADEGMAQTAAAHMPDSEQIAGCQWMPDEQMAVYASEYQRTGFQGGLQWYRCSTSAELAKELKLFAGRTIDVAACFIAGASDWGVYQKPGDFQKMQHAACTAMNACHLIPGAGHWVQQEQPEQVVSLLLGFIRAKN